MKLVTFKTKEETINTGWLKDEGVVAMQKADKRLPNDMLAFIDNHETYFKIIKENRLEELIPHYHLTEVRLMAPLTNPRSIRDYLSFEQHMLNASKTFGHSIGEAYYDIPVFYFTNHNAVFGPDDEIKRPKNETKMDFELELAVVMGKKGNDIPEDETDDYIFGYTIFNDWTARSLQREEMTLPLGPAKGKDFANAFGPCIVTKDEFEQYRCAISRKTHPKHLTMPKTTGDRFNVKMIARINGETVCEGNYKTAYWTFAQKIKRASDNVALLTGDVLGSGTVGWGSLIENNFSVHRPLAPGDKVELEIEGIGRLSNVVA
jgi:2-keto-4-pentenoate hydratase/2-oxohepta-3-ene-1,7-dioic acid hydratase in catechol pathway